MQDKSYEWKIKGLTRDCNRETWLKKIFEVVTLRLIIKELVGIARQSWGMVLQEMEFKVNEMGKACYKN